MSLFKLVFFSFLSLVVSHPALSTARLDLSRTPSCLTVRLPIVNHNSSNMRFHGCMPSQEGIVGRTLSPTFSVLHPRNGGHSRKTLSSVGDSDDPTSIYQCSYVSSSANAQSKQLLTLLSSHITSVAPGGHEICRSERGLSRMHAVLSNLVREVQPQQGPTHTLLCISCGCKRVRTPEEPCSEFSRSYCGVKKFTFSSRDRWSVSSAKACSSSPSNVPFEHTTYQTQTVKESNGWSFSRTSDFLCLHKTVHASSISPLCHGTSVTRLNAHSNAGTAFASSSYDPSKHFPMNLVASRANASPQTFFADAPQSVYVSCFSYSPPQQRGPRLPFLRSTYSSVDNFAYSPDSGTFISQSNSLRDSPVSVRKRISSEVPSGAQWPPWLPYGLPREGLLPKHIAESTSAASLQYAKKVFLDLLYSGRLILPSSSVSPSALTETGTSGTNAAVVRRCADTAVAKSNCTSSCSGEEIVQKSPKRGHPLSPMSNDDNTPDLSGASHVKQTTGTPVSFDAVACKTQPPLGEEQVRIFAAFTDKYVKELTLAGRVTAQAIFNILASTWQLAWKYSNYPFKPYHSALRTPLDFSAWSEMMWRPLVDFSRSKIVLPVPEKSSAFLPSSSPSSSSVSANLSVSSSSDNCSSSSIPTTASKSSPVSSSSDSISAGSFAEASRATSSSLPLSSRMPAMGIQHFTNDVDAWGLGGERTPPPAVAHLSETTDVTSPLHVIKDKLQKGENIIFLSNHQTEPDPQVLKLVFEYLGERELGQRIIFVAGHRVREDPVSTPFSLGCNLLCVHSKKHLTNASVPAAEQHRRQQHNVAAVAALQQMLEEGGALIWVAPSGGRDRQDEKGEFSKPDKFDSKAVRLFRLLAKKANATQGKITHFCPMAIYTAPICPPPKQVEGRLGEQRTCAFSPVGVGIGNYLPGDDTYTNEAFAEKAEAETRRLYDLIKF